MHCETNGAWGRFNIPPYLGKPDTGTLCNELASVSDWRKLGLNLGVQDYELDQIHRSHPAEGCDGWKRETFSLWLRRTPSASWRDVVGALQQMGEKIVAETIEQKYIQKGPPSKLHVVLEKINFTWVSAHLSSTVFFEFLQIGMCRYTTYGKCESRLQFISDSSAAICGGACMF